MSLTIISFPIAIVASRVPPKHIYFAFPVSVIHIGVALPCGTFLDHVSVVSYSLLAPFYTLSVTDIIGPLATLSTCLLLRAGRHPFSYSYTPFLGSIIFPSFSRTSSLFIRCSTLSWRAGFAVCCDRVVPLTQHLHFTCLPAREGESGEGLLACRLAFSLEQAADVSRAVYAGFHISALPSTCLFGCMYFSRVE